MTDDKQIKGSDLFIADNSDTDWKVKRYLHEWADIAHTFDIATVCKTGDFSRSP